jgi:hypothetical protein
MAKADYRTKAGECYRMAAMAPSLADQATWLKLASEWLAMSSGGGVRPCRSRALSVDP